MFLLPAADYRVVLFMMVAGSLLLFLLACFIVSFLLLYQKLQQQYKREKKILEETFANEVLQAQLEIKEQTLLLVSQEIHDNLGQMLSLVKLNLNMLARSVEPPVVNELRTITELVSRTIRDMRNLSKTLNAGFMLEEGLAEALAFQLNLIEKAGLHQTVLHQEGNQRRMDTQKEVIIFRIAQELLNNILKHAQATSLSLVLSYTQQAFILFIEDNGIGFEQHLRQPSLSNEKGSGLVNMQNRAKLIGAQFTLESKPNVGTTARLLLPY